MSELAPIPDLRVFYHRRPDERVEVGRLAFEDRRAVFQYEPEFLELGIELSPFQLAARPGLLRADSDLFDGLFGLFDDSLPDGWGRLLLERHLRGIGARPERLSPLDRLAWIGDRAIGALAYEPAQAPPELPEHLDLHALGAASRIVLEDGTSEALETLLGLGGSPQGARPKVLVLVDAAGEQVVSGEEHREGFTPHLVKFPAREDPARASGAIEFAYSQMARAAGVTMPPTRLLAAQDDHPGFFAIERFDRQGHRRIHQHTAAGLLHAPPGRTVLTYAELLRATRILTRDEREVAQLFRREAFNVFAHNRDDHARNFAFLMEPNGRWCLAPAYDLTFSPGPGGEHTLLVGGEGKAPGVEHLEADAADANLDAGDARAIIEEVRDACSGWAHHAKEAGVPRSNSSSIGSRLAELSRASS